MFQIKCVKLTNIFIIFQNICQLLVSGAESQPGQDITWYGNNQSLHSNFHIKLFSLIPALWSHQSCSRTNILTRPSRLDIDYLGGTYNLIWRGKSTEIRSYTVRKLIKLSIVNTKDREGVLVLYTSKQQNEQEFQWDSSPGSASCHKQYVH